MAKNRQTSFSGGLRTLRQLFSRAVNCLGKSIREMRSCLTSDEQSDEFLVHMSSLLDSVATGIISLDGRGRVRVFNAGAESLFKVSRTSVLGLPFNEAGQLLREEDHACRALWSRLSDAVWAAGAALELEYDLVPRGGPKKVVSYSVYPLGRTTWSVDNGVVIALEDITRKKEMEDQLTDTRKRLQAVFDGITDGIQVVDGEFRVTAVNKSISKLLQRSIRVGGRCFETCVFGSRICTDCPAAETFQTGLPASITKKLTSGTTDGAAGGERVVEISTFPLLDRANRVVQVVEYIKDVSERVRLADRLEHSRRLAELGEMAARVAHEVRNPLNAITGAAHFLSREYEVDETVQKFTDLIHRQTSRVNQVASDLLALSRPTRLNLTEVNVNAVLEQSLETLCAQMRAQCVTVRNGMTAQLPFILADELQIEQAILNILKNAVEAMPDGGVLQVSTAAAGGGGVNISIQDSGHGIAEEDRERIFQSFFTTKIKGTGLGLAIVQRVVKNHGGDVHIEPPEEGGTRVLMQLPRQVKSNRALPRLEPAVHS